MDYSKVDRAIEKASQVLNRVTIVRRDRKLALRGTFPTKPGEPGRTCRRYVALGIYAHPDGVKVAKAKAQKAESDLNLDKWHWPSWEGAAAGGDGRTAADWGKEFAKVKQGNIQPVSFESNYAEPLAALPGKPLTEELLRSLILSRHPAKSWGRNNDCMVYKALCKFAGIPATFLDLKGARGGYNPEPFRQEDLPSDDEIEQIWATIRNPGWRWVYGMMATYGLRPHEVLKLVDYTTISTETGVITTRKDTKTGIRNIWPLPDRWRHRFELAEVVLPEIDVESFDNRQLGAKINHGLCHRNKKENIPHKPYALRHAWAIRSAVMGVPDSIAARWMGHSVAIHAQTYHAAINQLQHEAIWRRANQRGSSI
ncbi:MAG: site-specific integrase [Cyanobacteria bacterium J06628_6]